MRRNQEADPGGSSTSAWGTGPEPVKTVKLAGRRPIADHRARRRKADGWERLPIRRSLLRSTLAIDISLFAGIRAIFAVMAD
jgi:hypothetical protein